MFWENHTSTGGWKINPILRLHPQDKVLITDEIGMTAFNTVALQKR